MKMDNVFQYKTKDLAEAAFLYASHRKLIGVERDSQRVWFIFQNDNNSCEVLVNAYWNKDASVNAKEYSDALRTLKDLIFHGEAT